VSKEGKREGRTNREIQVSKMERSRARHEKKKIHSWLECHRLRIGGVGVRGTYCQRAIRKMQRRGFEYLGHNLLPGIGRFESRKETLIGRHNPFQRCTPQASTLRKSLEKKGGWRGNTAIAKLGYEKDIDTREMGGE